jgi:hypothetical protein
MAQRGDPVSSLGGSYSGRGASRGTTRGSNNFSVYNRPSSTSGIDAYNERSQDAYYSQTRQEGANPDWRPSGAGAVGQGSTPVVVSDNGRGGPSYQQGAGSGYRGGPHESDPSKYSWESVSNSMLEFGKKIPIVRILGAVYNGELFSKTGEWLGDLADSPWNPVNWESGNPPEWTLELGDGTVLGRGGLENYGGMMTGGGGQPNNRWYNPQTQQYEDLSSKKQGNPEQYRALYGVDSENPEGMDVPAGSFYNYETKSLEEFSGGGYSNSRKVLRSNAWKNAGIDDLKLSDEEYSKLTEEEKQANFEARQAAAASDPMNFGGVDSTSPFGNDKITYNMGIYTPQNDEEENAVLREMFNKGEITQVELDRYLDDAKRSQGETSEQGKELASQVEFLKEEGGYSDEELAGFVEDFTQQAFSTQGVRSKDDYFDVFQDSLNALDDVDDNLKLETYNLYDTKREEDYNNAFDYLDSLRGTNDFNQAYASTDVDKRNAYLRHGYEQGSITEEAYLNGIAQNLVEDGEFAFMLEDGRIAIGTEEGIYGDHRILEVSDTEDKEYTQTERNYARANKLKLGEGTAYEGPTSLEGFTDEQNARRKEIARLDAGGYKLSDTVEAKERPKPSRFKKFTGALKTVGLNAITGGLYSAVPAGINILKGEGSTDDWLAFGPVALEATGLVTPPATSEEAAAIQDRVTDEAISRGYSASEAASMGYDASQSALAGVGLDLGVVQLTYEQTNQVIRAAAAENLPQYVAKEFGIPLLKNKLSDSWEEFKKNNMLPLDNPAFIGEWQDAWDSIPEDIQAGLNETFEKLYEGVPIDEALAEGVVEYIKESPVGGWIEDSIKQAGRDFDDAYLQPIKEFAEEVVNVDAAKAFLSNFDDEVIQPVVEPVKEAGRAIDDTLIQPPKEFVEEAGRAIDDTLIQPPKEFVEGLFDGTDEDEDDSFSSNIRRRDPLTSKKKSGGGESMILGGLFDRELFKFKEKDKLELEVPKEVERKRYVEGDLFDDPFASTFDDRNLV